MFEDRYGPCSELVVGDQLQLNYEWEGIVAIAVNPDDADRLDFTFGDSNNTVITLRNIKRVVYRHWVEA